MADALNPPLKIPINPLSFTPSLTPLNKVLPNPKSGTPAPWPAHSRNGSYTPIAPKMKPRQTNHTIILPGNNLVLSINI